MDIVIRMKKNIDPIIKQLQKEYPTLPMREFTQGHPFRTLIATILSQRSKDDVTIPLSDSLFKAVGDTPEDFDRLPVEKLEKLIFQSGFYRQKAKRIKEVTKIILEKYNGKVPKTQEELTSLPGVGRKTANIVLAHCFGADVIAVDTHVFRIPNRLGWIETKTPDESEFALMKVLPKKHWSTINDLLVRHGQEICRPIRPQCYRCPIEKNCQYEKKNLKKK